MPRLSNDNYARAHQWLKRIWLEYDVLYAVNPYAAQQDIHRFYAPTRDLPPGELAEHRRVVTAEDASLPNRAGKGLLRMQSVVSKVMASHDQPTRGDLLREVRKQAPGQGVGKHRTKTLAIARPEIDYERLAAALVEIATQQAADVKADQHE